jgi:hypothetical protein
MKALCSTVIVLVLASTASAGAWRFETVDSEGDVGSYNSIALDSSGYPHIAYIDDTNIDLKYARWDGAAWLIETVDSEGSVGGMNSLALDSTDYAHIAYNDYTNRDLKYARWDGAEWLIETVDSEGDVGYWNSLALDEAGYPHISYVAGYKDDLKYAFWDGAEWKVETVDSTGDVGEFCSLALDSNGYAHISYFDATNKCLKYARWDGNEWRIENADTTGEVGPWTSISLDSNDNPNISYNENTVGYLKYARWDGAEWRIEIVDPEESLRCSSLAIDSNDYPHISYGDNVEYPIYNLKYSHWDGSEWRIEIVDSEGSVGYWTSLALDASDNPYISYYDKSNKTLKLAQYDSYSFHLLKPEKAEDIETAMPLLDWEDSSDPNHKSYTLWWGTDPDFDSYNEVTGIHESEYTIPGGIEDGERIWWRVKSVNEEGGENWAVEMDWYFDAELFHLLSPEKGDVVYAFPLRFNWQNHQIPDLESYTLWWGTDPEFNAYNEITDIDESEYTLSGGIEDGARVYWRVKSVDDQGGEYWAEEMDWYFDVDLGGGIELVDLGAETADDGVLVNWRLEGDEVAGVRVLRSVSEGEPVAVHENQLPGTATSYLDRLDKGLKPLAPGVEYRYWLEVTGTDGTTTRFGPTEAVTIPEETFTLVLYAAYPSPSREAVNIAYSLPEDGRVVLAVYDLSGRRVATLVDSELTAGRHEVTWNCAEVPSGVYLYKLETDAGSLTRRCVVGR